MFVPVFDDGISSCNMSRAPGPGQARTESPDWTIANTIASRQKLARQHPLGVASILSNASWCGGKVSDKNSLTHTV